MPVGPGGMAPTLSLGYSSGSVADFHASNRASASEWDTQVGDVGLGWNLGGSGYIALTDNMRDSNTNDPSSDQPWDDRYNLVLNGTSAAIRHSNSSSNSPLLMMPEQFVKIEKNLGLKNSNSTTLGIAKDAGTWTLTSQDGTKHTFGTDDPGLDPRNKPVDSPQGMVFDFSVNASYNIDDFWQVNKWYLTETGRQTALRLITVRLRLMGVM